MENDLSQDPGIVQDFLAESEELLQGMDQDMVSLESKSEDADLLNRIFRALHTIKGTSGFLGFDPIVKLSHRAEDVLNDLRRGSIKLNRRIIDALLQTRDQLSRMLADISHGGLKQYKTDALLTELQAVQRPDASDSKDAAASEAPAKLPTPRQPDAPNADTASAQKKAPAETTADVAAATMRVDVRKLDELINLIGELVLERNRLVRLSSDLTLGRTKAGQLEEALTHSTARLSFITEELQTAGLKTRMVPIDSVFRKFPRLVRDIAHSLNKEVDLVVRGEETELDKTMVELVGDPLVHLVRNSLDHGLEMPDVRVAAGKPRKGTIRLEASQEGDQIVISVSDDGAGIDSDRVLRKAIEKGIVSAERAKVLTQREIMDFIFLPGFSTAEKANNLSGRGVGMDVVRSNLKRMNGTIALQSHLGTGTAVLLRLPLTLAILPVLLVEIADEVYALPLRSVLRTAKIRDNDVHRVEANEVLRLHGETLPLLRPDRIFPTRAKTKRDMQKKAVILTVGGRQLAVLVDHLVGQESTVIKPLGSYLHNCSSVAGATISGDGRVRLVLDPAGLLAMAQGNALNEVIQ